MRHSKRSRFLILCYLFTLSLADFQCPKDVQDNFFRDPSDCTVFYRCHGGQKDRFTCGPGTVFNPDTNNCDWPHTVNCDAKPTSISDKYGQLYPSASVSRQSSLPQPGTNPNDPFQLQMPVDQPRGLPNTPYERSAKEYPNQGLYDQSGLNQQPSSLSPNPYIPNGHSVHSDGLVIDHTGPQKLQQRPGGQQRPLGQLPSGQQVYPSYPQNPSQRHPIGQLEDHNAGSHTRPGHSNPIINANQERVKPTSNQWQPIYNERNPTTANSQTRLPAIQQWPTNPRPTHNPGWTQPEQSANIYGPRVPSGQPSGFQPNSHSPSGQSLMGPVKDHSYGQHVRPNNRPADVQPVQNIYDNRPKSISKTNENNPKSSSGQNYPYVDPNPNPVYTFKPNTWIPVSQQQINQEPRQNPNQNLQRPNAWNPNQGEASYANPNAQSPNWNPQQPNQNQNPVRNPNDNLQYPSTWNPSKQPTSWDLLRNQTVNQMQEPNRPTSGYQQQPWNRNSAQQIPNPNQPTQNPTDYGKANPTKQEPFWKPTERTPEYNNNQYQRQPKWNPEKNLNSPNSEVSDETQQKIPILRPVDQQPLQVNQPQSPSSNPNQRFQTPGFNYNQPTYENPNRRPTGEPNLPTHNEPKFGDRIRPSNPQPIPEQRLEEPSPTRVGRNRPDFVDLQSPNFGPSTQSNRKCRTQGGNAKPQFRPSAYPGQQNPVVIYSQIQDDCIEEEEANTQQRLQPNNPYFNQVLDQEKLPSNTNDYYFPNRRPNTDGSGQRRPNFEHSLNRHTGQESEPQWFRPPFQAQSQTKANGTKSPNLGPNREPSESRDGRGYDHRRPSDVTQRPPQRNTNIPPGSYQPAMQWRPRPQLVSTPKPSSTTPDYEEDPNAEESDPHESLQQKVDLDFDSSNFKPTQIDDFETAESMDRIVESDPFAIQDLTRNLRCDESGESDCTNCEYLNWLKLPKVLLKSSVLESIAFGNGNLEKSCYRRCTQLSCVAYSYSVKSGLCILFSTQVTPQDVIADNEYTTVIQKPSTALVADEWLYTSSASPTGKPMASLRADTLMACLHNCISLGETRCSAIGYNSELKHCKLYDQRNGREIGLSGHHSALQHKNIFEPDDQWRFIKFGSKHLNGTVPISTFPIGEPQECYQECLNTPGCLFISLEGKESQECHIYNKLSTYSENEDFHSFLLSVPLNASAQLELPRVVFTGNQIAMHSQTDLNTCLDAARKTKKVSKVTYLTTRRQCYLYGDSAQVATQRQEGSEEAKSFLITMPDESKDLSFKRLLGLNIYRHTSAPTVRLVDEVSGSRCLELCLQQNCFAVGLTYDIIGKNIDCSIYMEKDITSEPTLIYANNTELFVRTLDKDSPLVSENQPVSTKNRQCAKSLYKSHATENLDMFKESQFGNQVDVPRKEIGGGPRAEPLVLAENDQPLNLPHGDDFVGLPDEFPPSYEYESFGGNEIQGSNRRSKRSTYGMMINSFQVYENLMKDPNVDPIAGGLIAAKASNLILQAIMNEQLNRESGNHLLDSFMKQMRLVNNEPDNEEPDIINEMVDNARNARRHSTDNELGSHSSDRVACQMTRNSMVRTMSCTKDEVCLQSPNQIKFLDSEKVSKLCKNIRLNSSCPLVCRSGYKPSVDRVFCERVGQSPTWNTVGATCLPDLKSCETLPWIPVKGDQGLVKEKLHYLVKYDVNKKLPVFSMYKHSPENGMESVGAREKSGSVQISPHPCPQLKGKQLSHINYKLTNYSKGHLSPPDAFKYSREGLIASNYIINTAPQDPFTKDGPWNVLSSRLTNYLNKNIGYMVSGVCKKQIYLPLSSMLPVPSCFWKIVCTKTPSGEPTAVAFFHENTAPNSMKAKLERVQDVMSYTSQDFVRNLISKEDYDSIWSEAFDFFNKDGQGSSSNLTIGTCGQVKNVTPSAIEFWNELLTDPKNGLQWPSDFQESDQLEPGSSGPLGENLEGRSGGLQTSPLSSRRPERDASPCNKKVIAYVSSNGRKLGNKLVSSSVTHLVYASVGVHSNGSLSFGGNQNNATMAYAKLYEMLQIKEKKPDLKLMFSVGGWENSRYFSSIAANPVRQKNFIKDLVAILAYWDFDGVDILWQYPVTGGKTKGSPKDKQNYVRFLKNIREALNANQIGAIRGSKLLTITAPGAYWILDKGYDLKQISPIVDWINVLSLDYFGAWDSSWGSYTGPVSPLYFGAPDGFPGKLNVDYTIKQYVCKLGDPSKIVMGIGFYGRFWENVGEPVFEGDDLYRTVGESSGQGSKRGGVLTYNQIENEWLSNKDASLILHEPTKTPFLWNPKKKTMISFENQYSIREKIKYATSHDLGGIFLWSVDSDDESGTLLNEVTSQSMCSDDHHSSKNTSFKCNPLQEKRWWTQYDGDGKNDRMCGQSAPLINGQVAICDPDDPGYSCCSDKGFCGSGPDFCECQNCTDYGKFPETALNLFN